MVGVLKCSLIKRALCNDSACVINVEHKIALQNLKSIPLYQCIDTIYSRVHNMIIWPDISSFIGRGISLWHPAVL